MTEKLFNILSIDGGGIRGIFPAYILECIQDRLGVDLYDKFDMFAGTSTGAIIAAGLAKNKNPKEIVSLYKKEGPKIFGEEKKPYWPRYFKQTRHSKFTNRHLRASLENEFKCLRLGDIEKPLILPATDIGQGTVHIFKSKFSDEFTRDPLVKVSEAVLASCSAPAYFDPIKVGNYLLADGGIWANNPSLIAYTEAIHRLGINPKNIRILSVGTGQTNIAYGTQQNKNWGLLSGWKHKKFIGFLLTLQAQTTQNHMKLLLNKNQLLRINFTSDLELPLDDPTIIDELLTKADKVFSYKSKELEAFFN